MAQTKRTGPQTDRPSCLVMDLRLTRQDLLLFRLDDFGRGAELVGEQHRQQALDQRSAGRVARHRPQRRRPRSTPWARYPRRISPAPRRSARPPGGSAGSGRRPRPRPGCGSPRPGPDRPLVVRSASAAASEITRLGLAVAQQPDPIGLGARPGSGSGRPPARSEPDWPYRRWPAPGSTVRTR